MRTTLGFLLAAALVSSAQPARAQSLTPATTAFAAAAAADWATTYRNLASPYKPTELNPLLRFTHSKPVPTVLAGAAMDVAGVLAWQKLVGKRHPKLARIGLYAAAGLRVGMAVRNAHLYGVYKARW